MTQKLNKKKPHGTANHVRFIFIFRTDQSGEGSTLKKDKDRVILS